MAAVTAAPGDPTCCYDAARIASRVKGNST